MHVFGTIVVHQFQRILVGVFFTVDGHANDGQTKLLEAVRTASDVTVEGLVVQRPHDHEDGYAIGEELVLVEIRQSIGHGEGADIGSHQRVQGGMVASSRGDLSVQGGLHGDLTQVQGEFHVVLGQGFAFGGIGIGVGRSHQVEGGVVEVHLDGHFLLRHQQLASVKQRRMGGEEHGLELATHKGVHGIFHGLDILLLRGGQHLVIVMSGIHSIVRQLGGRVQIVVPALGRQDGLAVVAVVVQQGLEEGFVMVMIRLGFQQHAVDVDGQLFDQRVGQVGDGVQHRVVRQVGIGTGLESDFHLEVTAIQIQEGVSGRNQEFHGIDARGDGTQLREPHALHRGIRLGHLKDLQFGAHDPRRGVVRLHLRLPTPARRVLLYHRRAHPRWPGGPRNPRRRRGRSGRNVIFFLFSSDPVNRPHRLWLSWLRHLLLGRWYDRPRLALCA